MHFGIVTPCTRRCRRRRAPPSDARDGVAAIRASRRRRRAARVKTSERTAPTQPSQSGADRTSILMLGGGRRQQHVRPWSCRSRSSNSTLCFSRTPGAASRTIGMSSICGGSGQSPSAKNSAALTQHQRHGGLSACSRRPARLLHERRDFPLAPLLRGVYYTGVLRVAAHRERARREGFQGAPLHVAPSHFFAEHVVWLRHQWLARDRRVYELRISLPERPLCASSPCRAARASQLRAAGANNTRRTRRADASRGAGGSRLEPGSAHHYEAAPIDRSSRSALLAARYTKP